jgi:RNA polymerase sigma-70 factor, ECF subfamily
MTGPANGQDALYLQAASSFGAAIVRLARAYERDPDQRRDLEQDIHVALWVSLKTFGGRCSLRTWVFRVAHNTAVSRVTRRRRKMPALISLDELADQPESGEWADIEDRAVTRSRLLTLVQALPPIDRQVILLYLEDIDAASIAEIVGLTPGNIATKIHRIKKILSQRFHTRDGHDA